jgi:ribosome-associated protein
MIRINRRIALDPSELEFEFIRASGPGGQNVNKVATAARLRFDVIGSPNLPVAVKDRLAKLAGRRMGSDGILSILARRFRTQEANRRDAVARLVALVQRAAVLKTPRRRTKPSPAAKEQRLKEKRIRSGTKARRKSVGPDAD